MGKKLWMIVAFLCVVSISFVFAAEKDTDGDGMPDAWEIKHGLNPNNKFDAMMDLDGDKLNNLKEYQAGTDPKNANMDDASGVSKDWMKFYKLTDPNADDDGDGFTNKEEYTENTDPTDKESAPVKEEEGAVQKHPEPSMQGVRENIDASIPDNHQIRPNVWKFNDPIGDDKGPGYYTYPTNPVYAAGGFDILSFEVDASSKDYVTFKITINADLKQDWGMAADFDVQYFQIYIDTDNVPGSGNVPSLLGLNVFFDPVRAWDRVVLVSPQPTARVQVEADVKAKDVRESIVIPTKISGQGRTVTAVVKKSDLGANENTDMADWAWQLVSQSNEGFPDADDLLTRNVNEYRGLHRFGGGSDFQGDPELIDILVWPAKGTLKEAEDQFAMLNVWQSYADPKMDVKAVLPMISPKQTEQWMPSGGYEKFARDLAAKIKPPAQKDKYVSDNFNLFFKLFTRYNWNLDPTKQNFLKNSLEVGFDAKAFSDVVDFYMRWEIAKWDNTIWTLWNNDTPGQQAIALQASRCMLINPIPTVDMISIGNYELDYSPWIMGSAWYPDRDKFKGIFIDGTVEGLFSYGITVHYPLNWIGLDWSHGNFTAQDFAYGAWIGTSAIPNLNMNLVGALYSDWEVSPLTSTNNDPKKYVLRGYNIGVQADATYKMDLGFSSLTVSGLFAMTSIALGEDFKKLELGLEQDIDGNGALGTLAQTGSSAGQINPLYETNGFAAVGTIKMDNIIGLISILGQGFYIDYNYCAIGAARGDTAVGGAAGFGGSPTADVLKMAGNQSVHRFPQAADFVSDLPITALPNDFLMYDPVTTTKAIGWINDTWEGIAATGWMGATGIFDLNLDIIRASAEFSYIGFNNPSYTNNSQLRGNANIEVAFIDWGGKLTIGSKFYMFNNPTAVTNGSGLSTMLVKDRVATLIVPSLRYFQQIGKSASATLTYKTEVGLYNEKNQYVNTNRLDNINKIFNRHRIGYEFSLSLPIGIIKSVGEVWTEMSLTNETTTGYTGRDRYGAYAITEWEYAF